MAQTIMERFGFSDPDLTTPEHDRMLLWLNKNWSSVLREIGVIDPTTDLRGRIIMEMPIVNGGRDATFKQNVGFIDFFVGLSCVVRGDFFFEIKPKISSIGEVIRQIQFYRSHRDGTYIILTKTKGLKELFAQQNIYIFEYEGE